MVSRVDLVSNSSNYFALIDVIRNPLFPFALPDRLSKAKSWRKISLIRLRVVSEIESTTNESYYAVIYSYAN